MPLIVTPGVRRRRGHDGTLWGILDYLGHDGDTNLCLDAGDALSYTSGQTFDDRGAGGYDFMFGSETGSPSTGDEPTFTGSAGDLAAYMAMGGNDFFRYQTTNEAWMNALHQDSALFTIIVGHYLKASTGQQGLVGTIRDGSNAPGVRLQFTSNEKLLFVVKRGGGDALLATADDASTTDAWHVSAVSIDEATGSGAGLLWQDGAALDVSAASSFDATYTSPSASDATDTMEVGAAGNGTIPLVSGSRVGFAAVIGAALNESQLNAIYSELVGISRYGLT